MSLEELWQNRDNEPFQWRRCLPFLFFLFFLGTVPSEAQTLSWDQPTFDLHSPSQQYFFTQQPSPLTYQPSFTDQPSFYQPQYTFSNLPQTGPLQPSLFSSENPFTSPSFTSPPVFSGTFNDSNMMNEVPLVATRNYDTPLVAARNYDDPLVATRNLEISLDSKNIMSPTPLSTTPPTWDFSFPSCRSFSRNKPPMVKTTWVDPSETYTVGCFRRSKVEWLKIRSDFRNFYSCENFANIFVGFGVHAVISNTSMDQNLTNWYQKDVRSNGLNRFSNDVRDFGSEKAIIPVIAVGILYYSDRITDCIRFFELPTGSVLGEFASRTTRGYLVGMPTMLLGQLLVGAGRPDDLNPSSRWQPFQNDHGVSGHAFVGAMPFITLAQMSDNFWLKTVFYTCSTFTAWSRFNDEKHYFSQSLLGWYFAYLSCRAISKTEYQLLPRGMTVFPIVEPRTTGIGLIYQW